jgi:hypothetical protein
MNAITPEPGTLPPVVYLLLDHDVYVSVHQTWIAADAARRRILDEVNAFWQVTEGHPPPASAEDALRIEVAEVDPGPDQTERNRLLDRTRTLRVANANLSYIHLSTQCLRPAGHCWIHDPSPLNPLRTAPVHVQVHLGGESIYRACRHHDPLDPNGIGLHPDPDAFAFDAAIHPNPAPPRHPCCPWWCCLPEPPTEADHARAAELIQAQSWVATAFDIDRPTTDAERQILQDCVLERLAREHAHREHPQEP